MSTFSGLGTALSSLIAQRQALEVSGQNVANANTVGYTRQRASLSSLPAASVASMFATNNGVGQGTYVNGIERLGDLFADTRVRTQTSGAAYLAEISAAYTELETNVGEPADTGLASQLSDMWTSWQDVAKGSEKDSARAVLLERSTAVIDRIGSLYTNAQTQWNQAVTTTQALVTQTNATAANIADLNDRILAIQNSGGSANELLDQRDLLVTSLAETVGATARTRDNGEVDVFVGGNALVDGAKSHDLAVTVPVSFTDAVENGGTVEVVWADTPTRPAGLTGGRVAGLLAVLAPPANGGLLTAAAASYDALAQQIATQVNALHSTAKTASGADGGDFFTFAAGKPAALGMTLAVTTSAGIAVGAAGQGAYDGTIGKQIAALGTATDGPDASWSATVVQLGVRSASASSRASVSEAARASAVQQQQSQTTVDTDEETVNMLAYQRAYEGAARVMTAIDEMLDTLINRTGVVGR
ncbi:flagellar hook-associated protein 1 [Actinomycetota bacterium]|nr:flagellar hook-associated protein 1 [Actinomycetota bacterium]